MHGRQAGRRLWICGANGGRWRPSGVALVRSECTGANLLHQIPPDARYGSTHYGLSIVGLSKRHGRLGGWAQKAPRRASATRLHGVEDLVHVGADQKTSAYP